MLHEKSNSMNESPCPNGLARTSSSGGEESLDPLQTAIQDLEVPFGVVRDGEAYRVLTDPGIASTTGLSLAAWVPACRIQDLGDSGFRRDLGLRHAYVAGAMANAIASESLVEALARHGMLAFFGSAGLPVARVEEAVVRLQNNLGDLPHGLNLIHSPGEPDLENRVVELFLHRNVRLVEASAYLDVSRPLVRYRVHGIHRDGNGRIVTPNRVVAKASRVEVATRFFSPPPGRALRELVDAGQITAEQAALAEHVPLAQDVTAEADSGGHTDNRPALALVPTFLALRDRLQARYGFHQPLRVGAAGGLATPHAVAAAFQMGAAYVLTGTVNQACREAGTSEHVRRLLAEADQADVAMAPSADMFELGARVQVLKRGTMFAIRAARLHELFRRYDSLEAIPAEDRAVLEQRWFRAPFEQVWAETCDYFAARDPETLTRAENDPHRRMALVFRWYLGQASGWANRGDPARQMDYQIWCGPAMGAFNEWVRGTFLAEPGNRDVVTVALNLLFGAAVATRWHILRLQGIPVRPGAARIQPRSYDDLHHRLTIQRTAR